MRKGMSSCKKLFLRYTGTMNLSFHVKVVIAIAATVLLVVGGYAVKTRLADESTPSPSPLVSLLPNGDVVIIGEFVCLPHADIGEQLTLECAYGLKTDDGSYYALDLSKFPGTPWPTPTGQRISVQATRMSDEEVRQHGWQKYDIKGVLTAWVILRI